MDNPAQVQPQDPTRNSNRSLLLAAVLIALPIVAAVGLYTWIFVYHPCDVEAVKEASTILVTQLKTYDGVYQVASTASRSSPDHPVNTLKLIFMDTQEIAVPACMQTVKLELIGYMEAVINAFQAYRAGEADSTIRSILSQSDMHYDNFTTELEAVNKCAPLCLP